MHSKNYQLDGGPFIHWKKGIKNLKSEEEEEEDLEMNRCMTSVQSHGYHAKKLIIRNV